MRLALSLAVTLVACVPQTQETSSSRPPASWAPSGRCSTQGGCSAVLDADGSFVYRPVVPPVESGASATLELTTPWKTTVAARRYREGLDSWWSFKVDFTSELDPAAPDTRALVTQPWLIRAPGDPAFVARWTPSDQDVTRVVGLLTASAQAIVTGPTPAKVVTAGIVFEPNVLVPGRAVIARVEIENAGGSSARDVTVTTRSSLAALHNQRFAFGNVKPGKHESQTSKIMIPASVTGNSVTLVVIVDEAGGHGQPEVTQTVKLATARTPCPEGRFSRERYDAKRAKLLKAVADGSMTQAEFESYDAELVRCLD